jgi:predicted DNA-binding transcriptional regulator YafY
VEAARVEPGPPDDDGWVTVDLVLEAEDVALDQLTALGGGVEVLQPHSLRTSLRAVGEAITSRNG